MQPNGGADRGDQPAAAAAGRPHVCAASQWHAGHRTGEANVVQLKLWHPYTQTEVTAEELL